MINGFEKLDPEENLLNNIKYYISNRNPVNLSNAYEFL